MILRGNIRGNGSHLATYLSTIGENEKVEVFDIRGTANPYDLKKSLVEMSLTSELTRTNKGLFHVVINPRPGEDQSMTKDDWLKAVEILEEESGFSNQKRIMVMHQKKGRLHMHVAWERYDHRTGKVISNRHSRYAQNRARLRMEKKLYQQRTPERNLERPALRKLLTELWNDHDNGKDFVKAVKDLGYTVARSEGRRPMVIINPAGRSFDLVREIKGVRTKEVKARMEGLRLPNDKKVIETIRKKQKENAHDTDLTKKKRQMQDELLALQKSKPKSRGR